MFGSLTNKCYCKVTFVDMVTQLYNNNRYKTITTNNYTFYFFKTG